MLERFFDPDILVFTIPAIIGTAVFLLKMGLMALGGDADGADGGGDGIDFGGSADGDVDVDLGDDVHAGDSDVAFSLISVQTVAAFLMGFGTGGIAAHLGLEWSYTASLAAGAGFGFALMYALAWAMQAMHRLQSSGNLARRDAVGREAIVYVHIPEATGGRGQVRVVINDRMRIYSAVSDSVAIPTGAKVRITGVTGDNTLRVSPIIV